MARRPNARLERIILVGLLMILISPKINSLQSFVQFILERVNVPMLDVAGIGRASAIVLTDLFDKIFTPSYQPRRIGELPSLELTA